MRINTSSLFNFKNIVFKAFRENSELYILVPVMIGSTLIELLAMAILASISDESYFLLTTRLQTLGRETVFLIVVILFIIRFTTLLYIETRIYYISRIFHANLASEVYNNVLNQSIIRVQSRPIGEFINLIGDETSKASEVLNAFLRVVNLIFVGFLYVFMLAIFDPSLIIMLLCFFTLNFIVLKKSLSKLTRMGLKSAKYNRKTNSFVIDTLNSLRAIRSFNRTTYFTKEFKYIYEKFMLTNYRINFLTLFNKLFPLNSFYFFFALYIIYGIYFAKEQDVVLLTTLFIIILRLITIVAESLQVSSILITNISQTSDVMSFSNEELAPRQGIVCDNIRSIELKKLNFRYSDTETNLFTDFNCVFERGKSYAIVGRSGSGKSTLLDLIMNFKVPNSGYIEINGKNSQEYSETDLLRKIVYIGQEAVILNDSIRNNLFLEENYSESWLNACFDIVGLDSVLRDFPDGLDHKLNFKGTNLSGGQKQRINLLRGLLRKPDVLIIDEGLSALDSTSRCDMLLRIKDVLSLSILIIVSHDIDLIKVMDKTIPISE